MLNCARSNKEPGCGNGGTPGVEQEARKKGRNSKSCGIWQDLPEEVTFELALLTGWISKAWAGNMMEQKLPGGVNSMSKETTKVQGMFVSTAVMDPQAFMWKVSV